MANKRATTQKNIEILQSIADLNDETLIGVDIVAAILAMTEAAFRQAYFRAPDNFPARFPLGKRLRWRLGRIREWIKESDAALN